MTASTSRSTTFSDHVRQALELFGQPHALGSQSPLATPYVLGHALHGYEATPLGRGLALIALIERSLRQLWGGELPSDGARMVSIALGEPRSSGRYDCLVLELNYLKQRYQPAPKNQVEIYTDILHISRPTHDRHLRTAIEHLGVMLLQQLQPALQLEQPTPPMALFGRDHLLVALQHDLATPQTISLTGTSGIGKTSLAAAVAQQWPAADRFWYTIRAALNDQLESLLFALGHFLHQRGASTLWQQLLVDRTRIAGGVALGLALADLAALDTPILICIDEIDQVIARDQSQPERNQRQMIEFLDGLRGACALLLIGQHAALPSDRIYPLQELPADQLANWLSAATIPYSEHELLHFASYTAGNPRLVELCIALHHADKYATLTSLLDQLPSASSLQPIWARIERYLTIAERQLIQAIAVFPTPMPADAWQYGDPAITAALEQLIKRRLVQISERGGVALLPALREVIYQAMPAERREAFHRQAAQVRAERGEYTAAAYHLHAAGELEAAIELWYPQREHEINQGQATSALAIFRQISQRRVSPSHARLLMLIRAELYELLGEPAQIVDDLAAHEWPSDDPHTPAALLRLGQAYEAQGQPTQALATYQHGLDALTWPFQQATDLHVQRSLSHLRQREMSSAWREAQLAKYHAETMLGVVRDQHGDYESAEQHYQSALSIAKQSDYPAGVARSYHYLAMLAGRRHDLEAALSAFADSIRYYQQIGDQVNQEIVRSNLASAYIHVRQFAAALEPALQALQFFTRMGNSVRIAQNASNLAEAHAELGNLAEAQFYAELVLKEQAPQSHPYALYTLGTVAGLRQEYQQAAHYYEQSRQIAEANDDAYLQAFAWRALATVHYALQEHAAARQALTQARALFEQLGIAEEVRETDRLAAEHDA
ncbi:MAG: hypothetical protein Fur005_46920 [Roseiflexaceae bacterium]